MNEDEGNEDGSRGRGGEGVLSFVLALVVWLFWSGIAVLRVLRS